MPRTKGDVLTRGKKLNDMIARHFHKLNKKEKYLDHLSKEHPATYCSLVARTMPAQAKIEVNHNAVDLGQAMLEAMQRLENHGSPDPDEKMIDITPDKVDDRVGETLPHPEKPQK